jgi:nitrate/nitrite-specific signal transduction histidine kinase
LKGKLMHNKPELIKALNIQKLEFQRFLSSIPNKQFFDGSSEQWSVAHHVKHITSVINRIATGLANPGALPKREPATPSRDFATMHQSYLNTLQNTPSETLRQFGSRVTLEERQDFQAYQTQMISNFVDAITNFNTALEGFDEEHLETLGMPHPLLGLISSREMVFFTVFHNAHHQNGIQNLLEQA